jgi:hypothetical protein
VSKENCNSFLSPFLIHPEAVKKGASYMLHYMHSIRYFNFGRELCNLGQFEEGISLFIGGLEGPTGTNGNGYMPYTLADKRCIQFKTCGPKGDQLSGVGKVNFQILDLFNQFKAKYNTTNCTTASTILKPIVTRITQLMKVPMVQATLRYSEEVSVAPGVAPYSLRAEASAFAAGVLPYVHQCDAASAATIYNQISNGSGPTLFSAVKKAFEKNYKCMGITCADVGGIINLITGKYKNTTKPCVDKCLTKGKVCTAGTSKECCSKKCKSKKCT